MDDTNLRVRLVDTDTLTDDDLRELVAKPIAGRLVAVVYDETPGDTPGDVNVRRVELAEVAPRSIDEVIAAALANVRNDSPAKVTLDGDDDECVLVISTETDPTLSGRVLAIADLITMVQPVLPAETQALIDRSRGVLFGVPRTDMVCLFFIATGDLMRGAENLAANVDENFTSDAPNAVSPWLYWLDGDRFEEMTFSIETDGAIASIEIPEPLLDLVDE